ncbi:MAG: zinc ribbon domain-containing protein [Candidatus Heimdallarchaeaceae archaeon]
MSNKERGFISSQRLTKKFSRQTKGIMFSFSLIFVFATVGMFGSLIDEWVTMSIGFVIAGISTAAFFIFFLGFLLNIRKFNRIEEQLSYVADRIFVSFFLGFFFSIASFSFITTSIDNWRVSFYLCRIFALLSLSMYFYFFKLIGNLLKKLSSLKLYPQKEKEKRNFILMILFFIFLMIVIDTIIRIAAFFESLNFIMMGVLTVAVAGICWQLYEVSNKWTRIDEKINRDYFLHTPSTFEEKLKTNTLLLNMFLSLSGFLSFIFAFGYLLIYTFADVVIRFIFPSDPIYHFSSDDLFHLKISIAPFVSVTLFLAFLFLIMMSFKYNKISQLSEKTSNNGLIINILFTISLFVLIAGFFFNSGFDIKEIKLYSASRVLIILALLLFTISIFLHYKNVANLRKEKKQLKKDFKNLLLVFSSSILLILVILDTIIRVVIWKVDYYVNDYIARNNHWVSYIQDTLWIGYLFTFLYFTCLIGIILGFKFNKEEILKILPNYDVIPVKTKLRRTTIQPSVYLKPKLEERELVEKEIKKVVVGRCSNCNTEIDEGFRFCPSCGMQVGTVKKAPKAEFCVNCGQKIEKRYNFCPSCGIQLE